MQTSTVTSGEVDDVVSGTAVEGLFRHALARRMTPALRGRLQQAGLDVDGRAPELISRAQFARWLKLTVESLYSGTPDAEAYRQLGRDLVRGYSMTLLGGAVVAVSRVIGPRRTLERMSRSPTSIARSYRARLDVLGEAACHFWVSETDLPPTFLAGVIGEATTLAGGRDVRTDPLRPHEAGWVYDVRWRAA